MEMNFFFVVDLMCVVLFVMRFNGGGCIVFVILMVGVIGILGEFIYCVSKFVFEGLVEVFVMEMVCFGIYVSMIWFVFFNMGMSVYNIDVFGFFVKGIVYDVFNEKVVVLMFEGEFLGEDFQFVVNMVLEVVMVCRLKLRYYFGEGVLQI